jgi:hypothetical protein
MPKHEPVLSRKRHYPGIPGWIRPRHYLGVALDSSGPTNRCRGFDGRIGSLESLDGVVAGWDYSLGIWTSTSEVHSAFTNGYVSRPAVVAAMNAGLLNPFGAQTAAGQAALDAAKIIGNVIDAKGKVDGFDGKISKEILTFRQGSLRMASASKPATRISSSI